VYNILYIAYPAAAAAAAKAKKEAAEVKKHIMEEMQLGNMKKSWDDEVAAREVCIGNDRRPIANAKISSLGGTILSRREYNALVSISDLVGRVRKFDELKDYINEGMTRVKGLTHIKKDQLILEWINTNTRLNNGETLPRPLRTINKSNSQLSLTHEIAHILRHIIICYGISMTKIIGLLNCTAVLHLGRPLSEEEFPSTASLRLWMPALDRIDRYDRDELDKKTFGFESEHQDREERRDMTKNKRDKKSAHKRVKHLDDKPKCAMQGQQLSTSSQRYLTYKIEALPAKLQKEILIGYLKMLGTTQKEKEYESIVFVFVYSAY